MRTIIIIIMYLMTLFIIALYFLVWQNFIELPKWYTENILGVQCTIIGLIGGITYCMRSIYIHKCVKKDWDNDFNIWYFIRPFSSIISGFVSFIFLKAGILVLDAAIKEDQISFGYLAFAFIAGYNVDNFMKKIEDVASSLWGIEKSNLEKLLESLPGIKQSNIEELLGSLQAVKKSKVLEELDKETKEKK